MDRTAASPVELESAGIRDTAMFVDFYGLREQPFGVTPDPRFLYLGEGHREALAALFYGIESGRGFSALAAEPGMGKTSLLMQLLETMQDSARTAFLFQTEGSSREFLHALLLDLGIVAHGKDLAATHEALNEALLNELNIGRRVVVVIDEAQNLSDKTLESVRLLSNFETPAAKLMHIVLAGQPKLAQTLARPSLTQLRQRVSNVIQLKPFRQEETAAYVSHRLRVAGLNGAVPFSPDAMAKIGQASNGIPRNINNICFQALSLGFALQTKVVGIDVIREVLKDLEIERAEAPATAISTARPAAPKVPSQWPYVPPLPDSYQAGYISAGATRNSAAGLWGLAAVVVTGMLLIVLATANRAHGGLSLSQIGDVLFGGSQADLDRPPGLPARLQPPAAPAIEKTPIESAQAVANSDAPDEVASESRKTEQPAETSKGQSSNAAFYQVRLRRPQTTFDIARTYLGRSSWAQVDRIRKLNPQIRGAYQILPAGMHITLPGHAPGRETGTPNDAENKTTQNTGSLTFGNGSTLVRVRKQETLFQLALDHYGKSGWEIVSRIRALNPQLRDPYQLLEQGQWIRVPQTTEER